ncbi:hypothetical protein TIFTF001_022444 [Ficus carica]|uniref:Uncharacterized protein n=1 Tax=Ficus carica TaxID=3494 RepID=A0AA88DFI5_FICCA|nr:hypothetical protein TIFTF001_022444 [Ficus carica]
MQVAAAYIDGQAEFFCRRPHLDVATSHLKEDHEHATVRVATTRRLESQRWSRFPGSSNETFRSLRESQGSPCETPVRVQIRRSSAVYASSPAVESSCVVLIDLG